MPDTKKPDEQVEQCRKEVEEVLAKHHCALQASFLLSAQGNVPIVKVVAIDSK